MPIQKEITEALSYISPNISYSDWLQIGMALHDWDSDTGYELWSSWSMNGDSYEPGICYQKWNSFRGGGGISIKTLFKFARDLGYTGEYEEEETAIIMINPEELPFIAIPERKISKEVCELYGVRTAVSEEDGRTPTLSYFPINRDGKLLAWKIKNRQATSKKDKYPEIKKGVTKGSKDFFGQDVAKRNGGKKLFITEGEDDCLSLYDTIVSCTPLKWKGIKPSIVAVTDGAMSLRNCCINNREFVESFEEVIIVFDNDEEGQKATKKCLQSFPKFKAATLPPGMDCNDMRKAGRDKELHDLVLWKAQHIRQGTVVEVADIIETAMLRPKMGKPFPWPTVTKLAYGIRPHTIHIIGAAPKIGKSDHEYQLVHHCIFNNKDKVGVFDLENPPAKTVKKVASKQAGTDFTKPGNIYDDELLRASLIELDGKIKMYDRGASRDWSDIRATMEEMHIIDGVSIFIVDPITALISRFKASEANDLLNELCTDMADLVYKYPITLFCYSHVNPKPKGAKAHEDGARVLSSEFTGSRAMEKWFNYGWGIRRNRSPDCPPEERNISYLDLLFDRDFGESGTATLYYDKDNMSYLEV